MNTESHPQPLPQTAEPQSIDLYQLDRFLDSQEPLIGAVYEELRQGRKGTHWMWFIFPQITGLGFSSTAQFFAIQSREEAQAFLPHATLGPRLQKCVGLLWNHPEKTASEIFGHPDDLKLRSSMTLFAVVSPPRSVFQRVLEVFFQAAPDSATLQILSNPYAPIVGRRGRRG